MEYNNIRSDKDKNELFFIFAISSSLINIGFIVSAFVQSRIFTGACTILAIGIMVAYLLGLSQFRFYQWLFAKLEINAGQVKIKYGKKERAIDFEDLKAIRILFLTIRDDKLIRADRFILLQKGENRRYYKSQDRYYDIRKDENTIAVWYTEERYQKIMTFWYAAHGKEYVESADKPDKV